MTFNPRIYVDGFQPTDEHVLLSETVIAADGGMAQTRTDRRTVIDTPIGAMLLSGDAQSGIDQILLSGMSGALQRSFNSAIKISTGNVQFLLGSIFDVGTNDIEASTSLLSLLVSRKTVIDVGSVDTVGANAKSIVSYRTQVQSGAMVATGQPVNLNDGSLIGVDAPNVVVTSGSVELIKAARTVVENSLIIASSGDIQSRVARITEIVGYSLDISAGDVGAFVSYKTSVSSSNIELAANEIITRHDRVMAIGAAEFIADYGNIEVRASYITHVSTAGVSVTGQEINITNRKDVLLLSGDVQSGSDALLLSGDAQSGSDKLSLSKV